MKYHLEINKKNFDVTISGIAGNMARVLVNGQSYEVCIGKQPRPGCATGHRPSGCHDTDNGNAGAAVAETRNIDPACPAGSRKPF